MPALSIRAMDPVCLLAILVSTIGICHVCLRQCQLRTEDLGPKSDVSAEVKLISKRSEVVKDLRSSAQTALVRLNQCSQDSA